MLVGHSMTMHQCISDAAVVCMLAQASVAACLQCCDSCSCRAPQPLAAQPHFIQPLNHNCCCSVGQEFLPQPVASDRSLDLQSCSLQAHKALTLQMASVGSLELEGCCLHQLEALAGLVSKPDSLDLVNCFVSVQSLRPSLLSEQGQFSTPPEASLTDKIPPHSSLDFGGRSLHHQETLPGLVYFPGSLNFVNCIILAQSLRPLLPEQGQFRKPPEASFTAKMPPHSSLDLGGRSLHHQEALPGYVASECSLNLSSSSALLLELVHVQLQLKPVLVGQMAFDARPFVPPGRLLSSSAGSFAGRTRLSSGLVS